MRRRRRYSSEEVERTLVLSYIVSLFLFIAWSFYTDRLRLADFFPIFFTVTITALTIEAYLSLREVDKSD